MKTFHNPVILGLALTGLVTVTPVLRAANDHADAANSAQMQQMQTRMLKIHDLMHRIEAAKDPAEQQRLRQEQLRLMQENMQAMMPMMMSMMGQGMQHCRDMGMSGKGDQGAGMMPHDMRP